METVATPAPKKGAKVWIIVAVIIILAIAAYVVLQMPGKTTGTPAATTNTPLSSAGASDYQAVFLNNNQVYFGKIGNSMGSQFVELKDIYYLQVQQQIQPATSKNAPATNISLVKLGGELHGPTDVMYINRDQILLIEDLRTDSNLVKAIDQYKAGGTAQ
jgi:hypothetical protein